MKNRTLRGVRQDLVREDKRARQGFFDGGGNKVIVAAAEELLRTGDLTQDSFQNFMANLGIGTDNLSSGAGYGFNPVTRNRVLLEWIHRGSWIGGVAVDVVAQDMTREGVDFLGDLDPADAEKIDELATGLQLWPNLSDCVAWSRLYGGSLLVPLLDGQAMDKPLRVETVAKDQLKGFLVLDRWQVIPSLENLVTEFGPDYGKPMFYTVTGDAPGLRGKRIHHSRCLRLEGVHLPYWQAVIENLWGISVYERLYDRMTAFDSATTGAAQLVYRAWLRNLKVKRLREIAAGNTKAMEGLVKYVGMMRRFQSIEGITLIDGEDDYGETGAAASFTGLAEALVQFGQQLSGALQIPLVRLFGQSPAGLNSTGESDLRMYYDGIHQQQERWMRVPLTRIYRCLAASAGVKLPDGFKLEFKPLWQLTDKEESEIGTADTGTVAQGQQIGVPLDVCFQELKNLSKKSKRWGSITKEVIEEAKQTASLQDEPGLPQGGEFAEPGEEEEDRLPAGQQRRALPRPTRDAAHTAALGMAYYHGLPVVVEHPQGSALRRYNIRLPADYGYIQGIPGADGDDLDCYVGPSHQSDHVFVVDQLDPQTGKFDEHKVMLGYLTPETALEDYMLGHGDSKRAFGDLTEMTMEEFKRWASTGAPADGPLSSKAGAAR